MRAEGWADRDDGVHLCAHCGRPIAGVWVIEVDDRSFHAARNYRGADRRRCRDVAEALRVGP